MVRSTEQLQMRLPHAVKDAIRKYADMRQLGMTTAVRQLIATGLEAESEKDLSYQVRSCIVLRKEGENE